ncbi:MAG: hypothetical protein JST00_21130 [Deltaproteobacteria bacterium]|nr:hypothetical protein [Deltaproteobacteria bacterium]
MQPTRILGSLAVALASLSFSVPASADEPAPPAPTAPATSAPPATTTAPLGPPAPGNASVKMTLEATQSPVAGPHPGDPSEDRPALSLAKHRSPDDYVFLHGFRLGYGHVMNYDEPSASFGGKSLKEQAGLRSPHHFLLGYEVMYRVVTHSWLNVLLLGNVMIAGLEQSKFLPSGNFIIGAELKNSFQIGVGANVSPLKGSEAHTVLAAGWTPRVGTVYTPIHLYFIPDVDGAHRIGVTTGVTF